MSKFTDIIGKKPDIGSAESILEFKSITEDLQKEKPDCGGDEEFFARIPAPDLEVKIGSFTMKNPIATAAGCYGYGIEYKDYQKLSELGAVFGIGTTLNPCYGFPQPRIQETAAAVLQNTGYENPGVEAFKKDILPQIVAEKADFVLNICGSSVEEMAAVAAAVDKAEGVGAVELNLSCIDAASGKAFGIDAAMVEKVIAAVKAASSLPVIAKLPYDVTDITEIARVAEASGADAVTVINPPTGLAMNIFDAKPVLNGKIGALCGPAIKPLALKAVWQTSQAVKIPVIGCGGISDGYDVVEFLQAGASAVQVGSANFIQPDCYGIMMAFLIRFMKMNGFVSLNKLVGIAHKADK